MLHDSTHDEEEKISEEFNFLWRIGFCINSIFHDTSGYTTEVVDELKVLKSEIEEAIDILDSYEYALDEDSKHDFGFKFSEAYADVIDHIDYLNEKTKVCFYFH